MARVLQMVNGVARMTEPTNIYDQIYTISGTISPSTALTLPSAQTYTGVELKVYVNGLLQTLTNDYNYVGSAPRTQISMTYTLYTTDTLRFRIGD